MWLPEGRPGRTAYVWFCRTRCIGTTPALEPSASEKWNRTMAEEMVTFSVGSSRETLTGVPLGRVVLDEVRSEGSVATTAFSARPCEGDVHPPFFDQLNHSSGPVILSMTPPSHGKD